MTFPEKTKQYNNVTNANEIFNITSSLVCCLITRSCGFSSSGMNKNISKTAVVYQQLHKADLIFHEFRRVF